MVWYYLKSLHLSKILLMSEGKFNYISLIILFKKETESLVLVGFAFNLKITCFLSPTASPFH